MLAVLPAFSAHAFTLDPDKLKSLEAELDSIRGRLGDLNDQFKGDALQVQQIDFVRKWVDARVFYDTDQINRAVYILTSLVETPQFRGSRDYVEAMILLGKSLYKLQKFRSSQQVFRALLDLRPGLNAQETAFFYLIDSALKLEDTQQIKDLMAMLGTRTSQSAELQYITGKSAFFQGDMASAIRRLTTVPASSKVYPQARYYRGVAQTSLGNLDAARTSFLDVVMITKDSEEDARKSIRSLANIALGRLAVEQGKWFEAVGFYQEIPRGDPNFPRSMYELAWAYLNAEKHAEAAQSLEIVKVISADESLSLTASMDLGRLLIFMKKHEEAQETLEEVNERFVPIRDELDRFARSDKNLELYFKWLIHKYDKSYALEIPLSDRAAKWVASGENLEKIVAVLDGVAMERKEVNQLDRLAHDLESALTGKERVELFPALGDAWVRLLSVENALLQYKKTLLDLEFTRRAETLSESQQLQLERLRMKATDLEDESGSSAIDPEQYRKRLTEVTKRYKSLRRDAFSVSRSIQELEKELAGINRFILDLQNKPDDPKTKNVTPGLMTDLKNERQRMVRISQELVAVEKQIVEQLAQLGVGGDVQKRERVAKKSLRSIYDEMTAYFAAGMAPPGLVRLHSTVGRYLEQVERIQVAIDKELVRVTRRFLETIQTERRNISRYGDNLTEISATGESVARELGHQLFREANRRIRQTVLYADLGIIDLAWERKQTLTDDMTRLNKERSEKIKSVQSILDEMLKRPSYRPLRAQVEKKSAAPNTPGESNDKEGKKPEEKTDPGAPAERVPETDGGLP
jgi:tetratricopeptide (TPR) repeat protein